MQNFIFKRANLILIMIQPITRKNYFKKVTFRPSKTMQNRLMFYPLSLWLSKSKLLRMSLLSCIT